MSVFLQPIYTQTVGAGGAASLTFNNIPQGFTDLKVVISARVSGSGAAYIGVLPNNNASAIYSYTYVGISPSAGTVYTGHTLNTTYGFFVYGANPAMNANSFTNMEVYITNYSGGGLKQAIVDDVSETNAVDGSAIALTAILMNSNAPITSIVVKDTVSGGTLVEGSKVTIYGVSNDYEVAAPTAPTIGAVTDLANFASVAFTPAANDGSDLYRVTTSPSSTTTFGVNSPIVAPVATGTSYTYQVESVNAKGTGASAASSAVTSANSYASIATVSASGGAVASFVFTNIPQNYKHLQLRFFTRVASGSVQDEGYLIFNNASSGMNGHQIFGNGASVSVGGNQYNSVMFMTRLVGSGATANVFSAGVIDILDYSSTTKYKTARCMSGWDAIGSGSAYLGSGLYQNNAPVTSLVFRSNSNLAQYSHAALYGIA